MSAELVQSYNEQVLNRDPHEIGHQTVTCEEPKDYHENVSVEDDEERPISRSRHTSTSSSGESSEPVKTLDKVADSFQEHSDHFEESRESSHHHVKEVHRHVEEIHREEVHREEVHRVHVNEEEEPQRISASPVKVEEESREKFDELPKKREFNQVEPEPEKPEKIRVFKEQEKEKIVEEPKQPKPRAVQKEFNPQPTEEFKPQEDENDWAKKNQGRGKLNALIARFNNGAVVTDENTVNNEYKEAYGVGKNRGQLRQDVFQ